MRMLKHHVLVRRLPVKVVNIACAVASLAMVDYCQCTIAWLKDSKSYIMEFYRRAIGPESLIYHKVGAMSAVADPWGGGGGGGGGLGGATAPPLFFITTLSCPLLEAFSASSCTSLAFANQF